MAIGALQFRGIGMLFVAERNRLRDGQPQQQSKGLQRSLVRIPSAM
jgi:hypothetical protein